MFNLTTQPLPLNFEEYPRLGSVFKVWDGWCVSRQAPSWHDVKLVELPAALIPQTVVCDVVEGGKDYKYRFWGTGLVALFKNDSTGLHLSEIGWTEDLINITREHLERVVSTQGPTLFISTYTTKTGSVANKVTLRMPLMDASGLVTKIISTYEIFDLGLNPEEKLGSFTQKEA